MKKKWKYFKQNEEEITKLQNECKLDKLLATVLSNRGIYVQDVQKFLNPTRNDFYNPYLMPDMKKAIDRIIIAIEKKEKIIIFGDYDVDGITSITVLKSFFKDIGVEASEYIPNRLNEGYGLNIEAIKKIAEEKFNLMITVDCGITAIEEIEYAKKLGYKIEEVTNY